jgi:hypothetical protein
VIAFALGKHGRVRVWFGEACPFGALAFTGDTAYRSDRGTAVAVEMIRPVGGRSLYGLLGFTYVPDGDRQLHIEVGTVDDESRMVMPNDGDAAGLPFDRVSPQDGFHLGLPKEYEEGLRNQLVHHEPALTGVIFVDRSVHTDVGSSVKVTELLTASLANVLTFEPRTDEEIVEIVRTALSS